MQREAKGADLPLPGKTMELLQPGTSDTTFEDAKVLLRVHVERLVINGLVIGGLENWGLECGVLAVEWKLISRRIEFHINVEMRYMSHVTPMQDLNDKLKLLKVIDLKAILAKANVSVAPRLNKADLISKIVASQSALDIYHSLYPSTEKFVLQLALRHLTHLIFIQCRSAKTNPSNPNNFYGISRHCCLVSAVSAPTRAT